MKRSSANSKVELAKLDITKVVNEIQTVNMQNQIVQISNDISKFKESPKDLFDPKVQPEQCSDKICSFAG